MEGDRDSGLRECRPETAQWYVEAGKHQVMPVDRRGQQRFAEPRPVIAKDRTRDVLFPGTQEVSPSAAPKVLHRPHAITALVDIPDDGAEGVIVSHGGVEGELVGEGQLSVTVPLMLSIGAGNTVGADAGSPVTDGYAAVMARCDGSR